MAGRLAALETSHRKLRSELVAKDREVLSWKQKYQALARAEDEEDGVSLPDQLQAVQAANRMLRNQVHEMESFLQDYGLIWVGNDENKAPPGSQSPAAVGERIDFGLLFARLRELNELAGDGRAKITTEGRAARFDFADKIPLAVYKDGLLIRRGPFRPFSDDATRRFVSDVLDGYFPPEFKDTHPDGIVFNVKDCSGSLFGEGGGSSRAPSSSSSCSSDGFKAFGGAGQKIGGSANQTAPMSREEFLRRLPERIVSNGRVVNIRDDISSKLTNGSVGGGCSRIGEEGEEEEGEGGDTSGRPRTPPADGSGGVTIAQTPALSMLKRSATRGELHADREVTTLRIKVPGRSNGSLLVKMYFDDTVGDLRRHVAQHTNLQSFDLRAAFPTRTFRDDDMSLRDAGLVPNAALMVVVGAAVGGRASRK